MPRGRSELEQEAFEAGWEAARQWMADQVVQMQLAANEGVDTAMEAEMSRWMNRA